MRGVGNRYARCLGQGITLFSPCASVSSNSTDSGWPVIWRHGELLEQFFLGLINSLSVSQFCPCPVANEPARMTQQACASSLCVRQGC